MYRFLDIESSLRRDFFYVYLTDGTNEFFCVAYNEIKVNLLKLKQEIAISVFLSSLSKQLLLVS